jgi:phage shock protein PspC (stress-responsive transcriptional regulator)
MKRLYRSSEDRMIAGVCGGLGEVYGIDPTLLRLGLVLLGLVTAILPMLVVYILATIIIPVGPLPEE